MAFLVKSNRHWREILRWHDLSKKEKEDFSYLDSDERRDEAEFTRYRGVVYDLNDFERGLGMTQMPTGLENWDNYQSDSFYSGVVILWDCENDRIKIGTYFC